MSSPDAISITAQCHCSLFKHTVSLPLTAFPLKSALCSCTSCRHATGHLFATFAVIPLPHPPAEFFKDLIRYESSSALIRYSCPRCGATICNVEESEWAFGTGILEVDGGLDGKLSRGLLFVGDTGDGGAVPWINRGSAEGLACRKLEGRHSQDVTDNMLAALVKSAEGKRSAPVAKISGRCHCGDVKFELLRPGGKGQRYRASLCACTSCSKTSGLEITSWVFIPKESLRDLDCVSWEDWKAKLRMYSSSEGVERFFCKRCGANVVYCLKGRDTIDVPVGLLDAIEGSKSSSLLHWNADGDDVAHAGDGLDQGFVAQLVEGVSNAATA